MRPLVLAALSVVVFAGEVSQEEQDRIWREAMKQSAAQAAKPAAVDAKPTVQAPAAPVANERYSMESQYRRAIDALCSEALAMADTVARRATPREPLVDTDSVAEMKAKQRRNEKRTTSDEIASNAGQLRGMIQNGDVYLNRLIKAKELLERVIVQDQELYGSVDGAR